MRTEMLAAIKEMIRLARSLATKVLPYLEVHLADHCNLKCTGCGHYSQLAAPRCTDLDQYERDMKRLSQLFRNIATIRLMGGEPLLHPEPIPFMTIARDCFPRTDLRFVTNGILLPKAPPAFWEACRRSNAIIDLTVYPPFQNRAAEWQRLCERERVSCAAHSVTKFFKKMNLKGDSNKTKAFLLCRRQFFCPFLQQGRLYVCSKPALVHYFNERFGTAVQAEAGADIHAPNATAWSLLNYLHRPIETCRWCTYGFSSRPWSSDRASVPEWYGLDKQPGAGALEGAETSQAKDGPSGGEADRP